MKVYNLNGKVVDWKISGDIVLGQESRPRSQLHVKARNLIAEVYPTIQILEEVPFKPKESVLYFDFYLHKLRTVIEVHGEQHYKFNSMYHTSIKDFLKQKNNDVMKENWCEINNIKYIELAYNESIEVWKRKITGQQQ